MTYPLDADPPPGLSPDETTPVASSVTDPLDGPNPMAFDARAASGAVWISIETATTQATSLIVFTIMAHFLSASEFGLVSLTFVLLLSIKIVFLDQITTAVIRKTSAAHREYSTAFWISLVLGLIAFLILNGFSFFAAWVFDAPGLGTVIRAMSVILLTIALTRTQEQWLARNFHFKILATRSIVGALVGGVVGIACALHGLGVWSLVVQQVITSTVSMALLWRSCPWRPKFEYSRQAAREIGSYMRGIVGGCVMYVFNQNCDVVLVGVFFGPTSVGIYGIGKRLTVALHMVAAAPINGVAMPSLAEAQANPEHLRRVLLNAVRIVLSVCGPVFAGAAALDHDIIVLAFGDRWSASIPVFGWLAFGSLFLVLLEYNNNLFAIKNHPKWTTWIAIGYSAMALGLFFLLHTLRIGAIALPFVLPYAVTFPISLILAARITGLRLRDWLAAALPPLVSILLMYVGVRVFVATWTGLPLYRLAAGVAIGAMIYVGSMAFLAPRTLRTAADFARGKLRQGAITSERSS